MAYTRTTPDAVSEAVARTALGRETELLWSGRPRQGFVIRRADVMFIPFSLLWGGVSILLAFVAFNNHMHPLLLAAVGTLALAGVYAIFLRYPMDALVRRHTYYALTVDEAVIMSGVFSRKTEKIKLDKPEEIAFGEHADGTGTIAFGPADLSHNPDISGIPASIRGINLPKFVMIPEPEHVYSMILKNRDALMQNL